MDLQGSGSTLQGGTTLYQAPPSQIQPSSNVMGYNGASGPSSVLGMSTTGTTGTGTTGTGSTAPSYNTYQQSLLDSLPQQLQTITGGAHQSGTTAAGDYNTKILDFIDSLTQGQNTINNQGVQNELSRKQGSQGVLGMVGRGIQSGGVQLANDNAGNSSATEALARAYGILGRQQQTGVNNQYVQGQNTIQNAQSAFDLQRQGGQRDITQGKQDATNAIVQQANYQLAYLDSQLINASLPDKLNIQQQQDAIRQDAMSQLSQYDPELASGAAGVTPSSQADQQAKAQQLATSGTAATNPFSYTSQIPAQFQGSGPYASSLPIFTSPGKKTTA